jgi:hypothetical protein
MSLLRLQVVDEGVDAGRLGVPGPDLPRDPLYGAILWSGISTATIGDIDRFRTEVFPGVLGNTAAPRVLQPAGGPL